MPKGIPPERYRDIWESTALGHLATIAADGHPQVNPVWFIADGAHVYLSVKADTVKLGNLRALPFVAISISDPANPQRYLELRGDVAELELYETLAWVNHLARKYTGADFTGGHDGERRYKVTIDVTAWTAQG